MGKGNYVRDLKSDGSVAKDQKIVHTPAPPAPKGKSSAEIMAGQPPWGGQS